MDVKMECFVNLVQANQNRVISRQLESGQLSVGRRAYVNHVNTYFTPLGWLIYAGHTTDVELLNLFLLHGADPNDICEQDEFNEQWRRPLHVCAEYNNTRRFRLFLSAGADYRLLDSDGRTPYEVAVEKNCIETIALCHVLQDRGDAMYAIYWCLRQVNEGWPDIFTGVIRENVFEIPLESWNTKWWKRLKRK
jgi:ankyrin repeat protein